MILGESHYGTQEDDHPQLTEAAVRRYVMDTDQPHQGKIFTRVGHLLLQLPPGERVAAIALQALYDELLFANLVLDVLPSRLARPTAAQFRAEWPALQAILDYYQPERILVVGALTWQRMPAPAQRDHVVLGDGRTADRRWYRAASRLVPAMPIAHPATRRPWDAGRWACVANALLTMTALEALRAPAPASSERA